MLPTIIFVTRSVMIAARAEEQGCLAVQNDVNFACFGVTDAWLQHNKTAKVSCDGTNGELFQRTF